MVEIFTVKSTVLPDDTRVVGFRGSEGISRPYIFEVYLSISSEEGQEFDLADAVGARAALTLDRQDGRMPFLFHGIFSELSLVHEMGGRVLVRAILVPKLWRLSQTLHSRIFTAVSIPDIIKEVLDDGGLTPDDYVFQLAGQYKPEEHVCQYRESYLDFISRWMEREGLYYYFEHSEHGEKLIISDSRSFQDALVPDPVHFHALTGSDVTARDCLQTFICRHRSLPGSVRLKDYDYAKPTLGIHGSAPVSKVGLGEISVYGARFFTPEAGKRLAKLRAEELLAREVVLMGSGTCFYLRAGYTFNLEDHPRSSFNMRYLAIEAEHYGNQAATTAELRQMTGLDSDEVYRVDVTAIPERVQFRAESRTEWPRVYGTEHGVIDGEMDSEYAQLDEHGRYLVRFGFDESDLKPGKASTRVRMVQPHGGGIEGWHFPLRKGTEVLLTFLGGDPDRPVIAGVVPNTHTPSPVNAGNYTTNIIQTGGRNRIELEDKSGQERITVSTPHSNTYLRLGAPNHEHEMILHTNKNALLDAKNNWDVNVGGKLDEDVTGTVMETYHSDQDTTIMKGRKETILAGGMKHDVHGGFTQTIEPEGKQTVTGTWTHKVTGVNHDDYGSWKSDVGKTWTAKVGGNIVIHSKGGTVTIHSPTELTLDAPKVKNKALGQWYKETAASLEFYGSKNSAGVHKFDNAAVAMSTNGLKVDATAVSMSATGSKVDKVSSSFSSAGLKIDFCAAKVVNDTVTIKQEELSMLSGAFTSITKAFVKIG